MTLLVKFVALGLLGLGGLWDVRTGASAIPVPKKDSPVPVPLPADPAPCCSPAAPICACNQCVTQEELALVSCLVPEDDPDSINDCCPVEVPLPTPVDECCSADAPICSCVGCVTFEDLAAITCPADPPEPFNCCDSQLPDLPPLEVPSVPFDGEDCCDDSSICCCGACRLPEVCAAISCAVLPEDLPANLPPCCSAEDLEGETDPEEDPEDDPEEDPEEVPEEDPEEDPETDPEEDPDDPPKPAVKPDLCCPADKPKCACGSCVFDPDNQLACKPAPGWDGDCCPDLPPQPPVEPPAPAEIAECCTEEAPACCCGGCATQEFCSVVDCVPDAPAGCCGDEEPPTPEPPAPQPATCCKKGLQCCCGACQSPDTCAIIRCALDPEDDGTCCDTEEEAEEAEEEENPVRGWPGHNDCCTGFKQCCCGQCRSPKECALIDCFVPPDAGPDTCCDRPPVSKI